MEKAVLEFYLRDREEILMPGMIPMAQFFKLLRFQASTKTVLGPKWICTTFIKTDSIHVTDFPLDQQDTYNADKVLRKAISAQRIHTLLMRDSKSRT